MLEIRRMLSQVCSLLRIRYIFFVVFYLTQWDHLPPLGVPTVGGSSLDSNPRLDWLTQWTNQLSHHTSLCVLQNE